MRCSTIDSAIRAAQIGGNLHFMQQTCVVGHLGCSYARSHQQARKRWCPGAV